MSYSKGESVAYRLNGEWHPATIEEVAPATPWTTTKWDYLLRLPFGIDGEDGVYASRKDVYPEKAIPR